jgi:hypothetical protein
VPNLVSKAAEIDPAVGKIARRASTLGRGILQRWWLMSFLLIGCGLASGTLGIFLLLRQPPKPVCSRVIWPFASGSLRLYCAQEAAQNRTLEDLFQAIALVDGLPDNHPLRPLIDRWVEIWSKQALDLAEKEFDGGNLDRAIHFAQKIPTQTKAHVLVEQRINYWKTVWAKGDGIFKRVEAALNNEDWRGAFSIMVGLLSVDNRYWATTQYEALNARIMQAQKDETQLVRAQRIFEAGGLENLTKALNLVQDLSKDSIFQKSIHKTVTAISRALVSLAEKALDRRDIDTALNALQQIPREVSFWPEVKDWTDIAEATSSTWSGTLEGYNSAIAQLKKATPDRPLYSKMQDYILRWSADVTYVQLLQKAQERAADGSTEGLSDAINQARLVPSDSTQWNEAQQVIGEWSASLSNQLDQPILNRADELSFKGDSASLQAAIQQARQISSGSALYAEAQSRIRDWQKQSKELNDPILPPDRESARDPSSAPDQASGRLLQEAKGLAQQGTPANLASAIETANQISAQSPLRAEAQQKMDRWGNQMLYLAIRQAAVDKAQAIAIAQQIPSASAAYDRAQQQIQTWQTFSPRKPSTGR